MGALQQTFVSWTSLLTTWGILAAVLIAIAGGAYTMHASQPHAGAMRESEYRADQEDWRGALREIKDALLRIEDRLGELP